MHKLLVVVITCGVIVFAKLPAYIHKCSIKYPNVNTCALNSAKEAMPHIVKGERKFKIPVLDPLFVTELRIDANALNALIQNSTFVGLKDTILEKVGFDFDKKEVTFQGTLPSLYTTGSYNVTGKVATLPISGNGPYNCSLFNVTLQFKATYDLKKLDDGEVYMILNDYDCDIVPQNVVWALENMFNGNKVLGEIMNTFLNENWRLMYRELGKTFSMAAGHILFGIIQEVAKIVPFKDMFDDVE